MSAGPSKRTSGTTGAVRRFVANDRMSLADIANRAVDASLVSTPFDSRRCRL
jgi:hypothetical protein